MGCGVLLQGDLPGPGIEPESPALQTDSLPSDREDPLEEHNPVQYFCLESPMDRGAWQATVHRVTKSQERLKRLSTAASLAFSLLLKLLIFLPGIFFSQRLPSLDVH